MTNGERWYVIASRTHQELRAKQQLENQGFRVFLPRIVKSVRHARRIRQVVAPLFPGYLFVKVDIACQPWRSINSTFGVRSLLMQDERPRPVPRGVVESIACLAGKQDVVDFAPMLAAGDEVQVVRGPFAGLVGKLAARDARGRVEILLEVMGQGVRVKSHASALMPA